MVEIKLDKTLASPQGDFKLAIELTIRQGEFISLIGPSGAGKTTFLRILAGLEKPDTGHLSVANNTWLDSKKKIFKKANQRSVGLVFQDYALFPNLTVKENINYGLDTRASEDFVEDVIELMEISALLERKPATLSGGQSQRVALVRTLVSQPEMLLLDEPLAALDIAMRSRIQDYLRQAHERYSLTTIMVSHDIGEIFKLSDRVIKLDNGQISQVGKPAEIFFKKGATGRFQFTGEVLSITYEDVVYVITVLIGQQVVKVIAEENTAADLHIGDKVLVTSKAFNPIIQKANGQS